MHDSHQSIGILCDHTEWVTLKESACMIATSPYVFCVTTQNNSKESAHA